MKGNYLIFSPREICTDIETFSCSGHYRVSGYSGEEQAGGQWEETHGSGRLSQSGLLSSNGKETERQEKEIELCIGFH